MGKYGLNWDKYVCPISSYHQTFIVGEQSCYSTSYSTITCIKTQIYTLLLKFAHLCYTYTKYNYMAEKLLECNTNIVVIPKSLE